MRPTLPIDFDAIRVALVRAMMQACGLDGDHVITLEPEVAGAPRPSLPYMGLKVTTAAIQAGEDGVDQVRLAADGSQLLRYSGSRRMAVSFHAYGQSHEQAYGMMALWQASLQTSPIRELLRGATVSVWRVGDIRDLSALLNAGFEGRAQMDTTFGVLSALEVWVPSILVASAAGTINADASDAEELLVTVSTGD